MSMRSALCGPIARFARAAALSLLLVACDGYGAVGPSGGGLVTLGGGTSATAQIAGSWRFAFFFLDDFGYAHSSETTWQFNGDGSAVRTIVTRNHTLLLADATLAVARWRVEGTQVRIDFISPQPGSIALDFRFDGRDLILAGQLYQRVGI